MDKKIVLSILWIFLVLNYLYCDVLSLMDPSVLNELMTGTVGGMQLTQDFLLGASVLMEIPIIMVLISRFSKYKINRILNIIAGLIMAAVQIWSLFVGETAIYYIFFSVIEIATCLFIVRYAWKWKE